MFPLWNVAIAPVLRAAGARRVVEIGALRGENTTQMLEFLGPDAELHVIDPVPAFDPAEHEKAFPGQYVFHEDISHNVLPGLGAFDAALIDGDHNWYTVYHELRMLTEAAHGAGAPMPLFILHDVLWPYGRRDLYYAPEQIPEEFRQPYDQKGMRPNSKKLVPRGGLNPTMHNAVEEGGPRNGVMTAVDDFVAEYDGELRVLVLPLYFGLAFVVEEERLQRTPELRDALDRLEGAEGRYDLLKVGEDVRLRAMMFQHQVFFQRNEALERARAKHLDLLKASLLNEHHLEDEARLAQLHRALRDGRPVDVGALRDPARGEQAAVQLLRRQRSASPEAGEWSFVPHTAMGRLRLDHLHRCLDALRDDEIEGDLVDCSVGRGGAGIFLRGYLDCHELADRDVWLVDRFRAADDDEAAPTLPARGVAGFRADLNIVRDGFASFGLLDDRVHFLQGRPAATLPEAGIERIALLHLGHGGRHDVGTILEALYDRVVPGGFVVIADHGDPVAAEAVEAFRRERGIEEPLDRIDWTAVAWRRPKQEVTGLTTATTLPVGQGRAPSLRSARPATDRLDLSVVVCFFDMQREAARTLHSLSRAYQEGIEDLAYEVLVLDNGSSPEQRLDPEFVASFGPEFRLLTIEDAPPTPVPALNRGIREARGEHLALMIDGAHVLTPGVLRFGMDGLRTYAPAVVATQQWYVGPGQQPEAMEQGYDEGYEDRLFSAIRWPENGYRLFEIGHFVGDRDWLDGVWESNCIFVTRAQLEQVGGFDEAFSMPGAGYANLELYERLGAAPDITVVSILGEGSFHQQHGGDTTNTVDAEVRRRKIHGYAQHYAELRGRPFKGPGKPIHYVGRLGSPAARRTKARRLGAERFGAGIPEASLDGLPTEPVPVPEELSTAFTEAVWRGLDWQRTRWLGVPVTSTPNDLLSYQEILTEVRPDWVVEVGTGSGGRALFLASVCELLGHGEVVSIDTEAAPDLPVHARLRYLTGEAHGESAVGQVRSLVGDGRAVVVLGGRRDRTRTARQFEAYAPLVPPGSYVIVTDTIVNGRPVWPAFGPGPAEAVKQVLLRHGDFVSDPGRERLSFTFDHDGYLKRLA